MNEISDGKGFLDIGANIGYFSLLAHKKFSSVYTFEPNTELFRIMKANFCLNDLPLRNNYKYALFSENKNAHLKAARGKIIIEDSSSFQIKDSDKKAIKEKNPGFEEVKLRRLDDLQDEINLGKIDFIKMDIEGAEIDALYGMVNILSKNKPGILLSVHPQKMKAFGRINTEVYSFFKTIDYGWRVVYGPDLKIAETKDIKENYTLYCFSKPKGE